VVLAQQQCYTLKLRCFLRQHGFGATLFAKASFGIFISYMVFCTTQLYAKASLFLSATYGSKQLHGAFI